MLFNVARHVVFLMDMKDEMRSNFEIHLVWAFFRGDKEGIAIVTIVIAICHCHREPFGCKN